MLSLRGAPIDAKDVDQNDRAPNPKARCKSWHRNWHRRV